MADSSPAHSLRKNTTTVYLECPRLVVAFPAHELLDTPSALRSMRYVTFRRNRAFIV
jgi:hypothetical protein